MMSSDDIEKIVKAKIEELGVEDKSKMGILMGAVMKETKGEADGAQVKAVIEKLLQGAKQQKYLNPPPKKVNNRSDTQTMQAHIITHT